jgi:hypothetical protein
VSPRIRDDLLPEPDIASPPPDVLARLAPFVPALDQAIPAKQLDRNLLVGSWNLRAFGGLTKKWEPEETRRPGRSPTSSRSRRSCPTSTSWRCRRCTVTSVPCAT